MRRSSMVSLTVLPILASAAVAAANPPEVDELSPPGLTEPELSPPGLTPEIWQLDCDEDPSWELRTDCHDRPQGDEPTVIRGGFGQYFHLGSSHRSGSSGGG